MYENRLGCETHTVERVVVAGRACSGVARHGQSGLIYVPVEHDGCVYESVEEEDRIAAVVRDLLELEAEDERGCGSGRSGCDDILVVAPYNVQVWRLGKQLAGRSGLGRWTSSKGRRRRS